MKKIILTFVILIYLVGANSLADIIKQIKISGNKNISKERLEVFADIKLNDKINEKLLNEIIYYLNKIINNKKFKKYRNIKPSSIRDIMDVYNLVRLKTQSISV